MKTRIYNIIAIIILLTIVTGIGAQSTTLPSSQLKKQADKYFKEFSYLKAAKRYHVLENRGDVSEEILYKLGTSYYYLKNRTKSNYYLKRVIEKNSGSKYWMKANHSMFLLSMYSYYTRRHAFSYAKNVWNYCKNNPSFKKEYEKLLYNQIKILRGSNYNSILSKFIEIFSDFINEMQLNKKQIQKALYYKGMLYYRYGLYRKFSDYKEKRKWYRSGKNFLLAKETWEKLFDKYPSSVYSHKATYLIGLGYLRMSNFLDSIKWLDKLIKKYPQSEFYDDAKSIIFKIKQPRIYLRVTSPFFPGENKGHVYFRTRNVKKINLTMYRVNLLEFHKNYYRKISLKNYKLNRQNIVKQWEFETGDKSDHHVRSGKIKVPYNRQGAYFIEAKSGNLRGLILYLVSDISLITKKGKHRILAYVVNGRNSNPVNRAKVFADFAETGQFKNTVYTKRNGTANIAYPSKYSGSNYIVAKKGSAYAISSSYYRYYRYYSHRNYKNYVYSERPIYRPGQKVFIKAILKRVSAADYLPAANVKATVVVFDSRRKKVFEKIITTSENGTLDSGFTLPKNASLGVYRVLVMTPDRRRSRYYYRYRYDTYFRVEEYKRPEFEVKLNTVQKSYVLGDKLTLRVKAKYYYGQPVAGARTVISIRKRWHLYGIPYYLWRKYYRKYGYRFYYMFKGRKYIKAKNIKTDEKGVAYIDFKTEEEQGIPDELRKYVKYTYYAKSSVTDESRRQIHGNKTINISLTAFIIKAQALRAIYTPGDKVQINVKTITPAGLGVSRVLNLKLQKYIWKNGEIHKKLLRKSKVRTDSAGEYLYSSVVREKGLIVLEATGFDKRQTKVTGSSSFWFVDENYKGGFYRYRGIEIITNKKVYKPGDKMKVLINTQHGKNNFLVTVEGKTLYTYRSVKFKGNSKLLVFNVKKNWAPNIFIQVRTVKEHKVYSSAKRVIVPPKHHYITVKVKLNKDEYLPGEKAYADIQTLDWKGRPISAEVALSVYDSSLLYIQSRIAPDIKKYFYGRKVYNSVRTYTSYSFSRSLHAWQIDPVTAPEVKRDKIPSLFGYGRYYYAFGYGRYRNGRKMAESGAAKPSSAPGNGDHEKKRRTSRSRDGKPKPKKQAPEESAPDVQPEVRKKFNETVCWKPKIITNSNGRARISFKFSDSLTTWEVVARAVKSPALVGQSITNVVTTKNVIVRLQSPRFFTERDRSYISAIVHNYLKKDKWVTIKIALKGGLRLKSTSYKRVFIKANGKYRADFIVKAFKPGETKIMVSALTNVESDAMEKKFNILPYGAYKFVAYNGEVVKNGLPGAKVMSVYLPMERRQDATNLKIVVTPSLAMSILDALPYLAKFPYGCVEQTLSRFIPTVMVKKSLKELGIDPNSLKKKIDPVKVDLMVKAGLKRLYDFQHSSGGWGWWKKDADNNLMTSLVVYGLIQAKQAGYNINSYKLSRAIRYLQSAIKTEERFHTRAYMLYAMSFARAKNAKVLKEVYENRNKLNVYSMALLAMTLKRYNENAKASLLIENIEDYAKVKGNQAWWGRYKGYYYWYDDAVETTAAVVKAMANIKPDHKLIRKAVRWLVNNRRGTKWKSTKDTAAVIYAFIDYIKVKKENFKRYHLKITFNGRSLTNQHIAGLQVLAMNNVYEVPRSWIKTGDNSLVIMKNGMGITYYSVFMNYFTRERKIKAAGNLIHIQRKLRRLKPYVTGKRVAYKRIPWTGTLDSGDLVEVELTVKAENDFSYLMIEDPKPAGCESVNLRSGGSYFSHIEFRDTKIAMFIGFLRQGTYRFRYRLRAEIPGDFSQMPAKVSSMYVPEFRGISDSHNVKIIDVK